MKRSVTLIVVEAVVRVLLVSPSALAADSDAERVVVTSQSAPFAPDVRSGRRHEVRYQAISIWNRGDRPIALIGIRSRNAEVLVLDGFVNYYTTALSNDSGWAFEGPRDFYRLIAPDAAIALTVAQRATTDEGSAPVLGDSSLDLLFADGSSLAI